MPCSSWGISPTACKTGSKLRLKVGSTCSKCYACKGHYPTPNVVAAHKMRLAALKDPRWTEAMIKVIYEEGREYFRWFDSGDVQSLEHYDQIRTIAQELPDVKFWMPTQEWRIVKQRPNDIPNLNPRISSPMLGKVKKRKGFTVSAVVKDYSCIAPQQDNECGDCRDCWDKTVELTTYKEN